MSARQELSVNWRGLFDALHISWRDRGANTSRGQVNIACPWCGDDPSFHLSVSEEIEAYHCYRNRQHSGRNFAYLLERLGQSRTESYRLLDEFEQSAAPLRPPAPLQSAVQKRWETFENAALSPLMLSYLEARGFPEAERLCRRYDLRFSRQGSWAQRLLIPIHLDDKLFSWIGRAVRPTLQPKYKMQPSDHPGLVYCPARPRKIAIVVEGPIDALKIEAAQSGQGFGAIALVTSSVNPAKLLGIREHAGDCSEVFVALDADVRLSQRYDVIRELAALMRDCYIKHLPLPVGIKDPGEMSIVGVKQWLKSIVRS